jgi:putative polyhydroxyalkanoate system protein
MTRGGVPPRPRAPILPVLSGPVHRGAESPVGASPPGAMLRRESGPRPGLGGLRRVWPGLVEFGYTRRSSTGTAMSTISIAKKHHLSHKKAKEAAQKVAEDLQKRFSLDYEWNGDCVTFKRAGLSGELVVHKTEVRLDCKLGFLLTAIKPAIEQEVHKEFDKRFGVKKA